MPHVSRHKLKDEVRTKLFKQLAQLIAKSSNSTAGGFLQDLLTDTEETMLAKRLAVVLMLHEGCSVNKICGTLKMSKSTVVAMHHQYRRGHYIGVVKLTGRTKADRKKLWDTIELVLRCGMPPMGKDRWKYVKF